MNTKENLIKGTIVTFEELKKIELNRDIFSYYVDATVKVKDGIVVFGKCKAIESDGEETIYFTEGDDCILIFTVSGNPNMTIKKLLLN